MSKNIKKKNKLVYVAMSGGVDSSVSAGLLKKQGFDVVGVFFKPWSPSEKISFCDWKKDRMDAMQVALKLGIEFKTWDFSKEYGDKVTDYMVSGYKNGITPNPDVMCNKEIKFGIFLKKAIKEGADYIATGHYARIVRGEREIKSKLARNPSFKLLKGKDSNKDQSYFLWTLTQDQLKYVLFPAGDYVKPQIRVLAKKMQLLNHSKKDSQGVCFVGDLDMKSFLKEYIKPKKGDIILKKTGEILGSHDGIYYYTIGQRHGMDIKIGGGPYYVIDKNIKENILYVSNEVESTKSKECRVKDINWIKNQKFPLKINAKIRYRTNEIPAIVYKNGKVKFRKPASSVTIGQSVVFYKKDEVIGGGVIC